MELFAFPCFPTYYSALESSYARRVLKFRASSLHESPFHAKHWHTNTDCIKIKQMLLQASAAASTSPSESLKNGTWVKLICGASFEDVVDIRNLSVVYTLAGVDCIDCAADASVVTAVNEGINMAEKIRHTLIADEVSHKPWVMISVNDDEDVHFRKAYFDPEDCPPNCSRPCEALCPANAIRFRSNASSNKVNFHDASGSKFEGVIIDRCYGCGRCIPVCPYDLISANSYVRNNVSVTELLLREDVHAIEIHTNAWHLDSFRELWSRISEAVQRLKLVAVSLSDSGDDTMIALRKMYTIMSPCLETYNLWQLDGRPMSGDIGRGSTKDAVDFAARIAADKNRPPGFLQLAGGTNFYTANLMKTIGLLHTTTVSGVAFGGYARKIVGRILYELSMKQDSPDAWIKIEEHPAYLLQALQAALSLLSPYKCYSLQH